MDFFSSLIAPFSEYSFMKRAMAACLILSLSGTPLGVFITLRRMTLVGDAVSHAVLPGIAVAFFLFGFAVLPMAVGGIFAGVIIAMLAILLVRFSSLKTDTALAVIYLSSLAVGVVLISLGGTSVDLSHFLIGDILAVDDTSLILISFTAIITVFAIAVFYRAFIIQSFDDGFSVFNSPSNSKKIFSVFQKSITVEMIFYVLLIINLISAFFVFGTLMGLGIILLPAITARCLSNDIDNILPLSVMIAIASSVIGLEISYHFAVPSGACIVLIAGISCFFAVFYEILSNKRNVS